MLTQQIIQKFSPLRLLAGVTAGCVVALNGTATTALAQNASESSLYQAGVNAGYRLVQEGYTLGTLDGAPYYTAFLRDGEVRNIRVDISRTGKYVLLIGGDNDTADLDVYAPQIDAWDTSYGSTGFIEFTVFRPGEFRYQVDMSNCRTVNCGMYAVLLKVSD